MAPRMLLSPARRVPIRAPRVAISKAVHQPPARSGNLTEICNLKCEELVLVFDDQDLEIRIRRFWIILLCIYARIDYVPFRALYVVQRPTQATQPDLLRTVPAHPACYPVSTAQPGARSVGHAPQLRPISPSCRTSEPKKHKRVAQVLLLPCFSTSGDALPSQLTAANQRTVTCPAWATCRSPVQAHLAGCTDHQTVHTVHSNAWSNENLVEINSKVCRLASRALYGVFRTAVSRQPRARATCCGAGCFVVCLIKCDAQKGFCHSLASLLAAWGHVFHKLFCSLPSRAMSGGPGLVFCNSWYNIL